jgi:conjugative relaxase-like TrwC/TraI family protein
MLSLANVGGSRDAGRYYEKADDYYTKDRSPSDWQGKAASVLNLQGEVKIEDFRNLLDGVLPNGETIQVAASGRRGGTDLTFSAPKSISMQALIGGDLRLVDAHDQAVARSLKYAETLVAHRQTNEGETEKILSKNMVAATFRHELSRACDPQLHTHSVVLNLTQKEDGKWRAMDNELFFRQKMLMGAFYRAELAHEVQKLGYEIRVTHSDGRFELHHITDTQIDQFSQRSQEIEAALKKDGETRETVSPKEKDILTIATRPKKTDVDRQVLKEYWQEKSQEAQINYQREFHPPSQAKTRHQVLDTVSFAIEHAMERQAAVKEDQLIREALQYGVGKTTYGEIKAEIENRVNIGSLIHYGERYTTPEAMEREKTILQIEKEGRGLTRNILEKKEAQIQLKDRGLNDGQRNAAELILTSNNRIVGVQGLAGTGKTFMLEAVRELAETKDFKMIGLAPSAAAANQLAKTGMECQTIALFQTIPDKQFSPKTILVVDEAGMVSSKQMEFILKTAERNHSKVLLIGDTQQLKAIEAGKPFAQLQAYGMATIGMSEIQRQKNPELKLAVQLAAKGEVIQSLSLLEKSVTEIKNNEDRYAQIATEYTAIPQKERDGTLIVSGTNEARKSINQKVRENLGLVNKGTAIPSLEEKTFTKAQLKKISSYQVGNIIQTERNYKSLGLQKGELSQIREIKQAYIVLQKSDGSFIKWKPHEKNKVSVYTRGEKEISQGEIVRMTRNDPQKRFNNGDRAKVIKIDENQNLYLQKEGEKILKLDGSKPLYLEYGYCSTVHSAQGKTCERVLIEADTKSLTSAQDNYYVAISRARHEAKIYTNDKEKIPEVMSRKTIKEAALEITRKESGNKEIQDLKNNMSRMNHFHQLKNPENELELNR